LKKETLHKIISVFTVALLLLPVGLQLLHTLENHEHKVCHSEDVQHIHKQELDCSIYHVKLRTESPDLNIYTSIFVEVSKNNTPLFLAIESSFHPQKNVTTRGSPLFII